MNRLKLIGHKWYVFFVTLKHVVTYIFKASERVAGLKIIIFTEEDLDHLDREMAEDDVEEMPHVDPKDLN